MYFFIRKHRMVPTFLKRLCKPSTRAFWNAARKRPGGSVMEAVHGLFYLKWPELYISIGLGRSPLVRFLREPAYRLGRAMKLWGDGAGTGFADTYHGKTMPLPEAERLIRLDRPLKLEVPERVLPYAAARDIILDHPGDIALLRCPCRATMKTPCLPLEVCILAGKHVVDFVLEHHPRKARRVSVDEAVGVLRDSRNRGHVSHAFFKEAVLGRYYAICNCCSCCCGAIQAHRSGTPMLAPSGYTAVADPRHCTACGKCVKVCQFGAVALRRDKDFLLPVIDRESCFGCGVCVAHCAKKAIRLERDPAKPAPLVLNATGDGLELD